MKLGLMLAILFVVSVSTPSPLLSQRPNDIDLSQPNIKWVASSMKEIATVKKGMTRSDLLRIFQEEGGLSAPSHRTYGYRGCPYFKVDVDFRPASGSFASQVRSSEQPSDIIVNISKPYLDWIVTN